MRSRAPKWILDQRVQLPVIPLGSAATAQLDGNLSELFSLTLSQNVTLSAVNLVAGVTYQVFITGGGGSDILTFGAGFTTTDTITPAAATTYVLNFSYNGSVLVEQGRPSARGTSSTYDGVPA
jgi:hypothetical protein